MEYYAKAVDSGSKVSRDGSRRLSAVSLPVSRPAGRALVVAGPGARPASVATLRKLGFQCSEVNDPYSAMAELCRRPSTYQALVLGLSSLYLEELQIIPAVKRAYPHVEVWLTHAEQRQATLAEAMRLGADGQLTPDGLKRTAGAPSRPAAPPPAPVNPPKTKPSPFAEHFEPSPDSSASFGEPLLTAEELRALLQEDPSPPRNIDS